ncbi:MAG: right-handed parallel beta-helix repeat-containing protein, partial [Lentisphaeria bacterium]|nr:right-handed parallel beta-helix repeat-containing protein [Lentisphaeria bacterium]
MRARNLTRVSAASLLAFAIGGCATGKRGSESGFLDSGPVPANAACILHLAPTGDDANPGTADAPLATLLKARDMIREKRAAKTLGAGPVVIQLRGGIYRFTKTLTLGKEDSGSEMAPVIWMATPGETVRLVGGVRLDDWRPVADPVVRARFGVRARANVLETDLSGRGVTNFGIVKPGIRRTEVFFNSKYLPLARYPNADFVRIADVSEKARKARPVKDPKRPDLNRHEGPFNYSGDRPERWGSTKGVWVHGYWLHDWSDQHHEVLKFDFDRKELWVKPPYHAYGYKKGQRYYYLNVLDELDEPGEWYLDRASGTLYLWPPSPIEEAEVLFPDLEKPMVVLDQAEHVSIRGIVFECSRAGAIVIKGGRDCDISGCVVRNVGDMGINVKGGTRHTIRSCDVYEVAARAIGLSGGDRKTLQRGEHVVENCHLHHFARVQKTYRPAVQLAGVGNRISHCYIHDCPHEGIGYAGNDHVIEYTEFTRVAQETGDVGAIYAAMDWTYTGHVFRYNYFHRIHGPGKLGCFTVYPDLPCGGIHLHGNILYDVDQVFHTNSGRGMLIENNVFLKARRGMSFSVWGDRKKFQKGGNWRMVERLAEVKYDQPPYSTRYPMLARLAADFAK